MATINLGRIKPVFQGAYNNSTAYVVDDIVTFGGETFICILASTGNATSNATYWSKLAKKGDDVSQLTTHGDFLFRGASGVERLPAGTSGQVLQTKGAGQDPQFADATSINWDYRNSSFTAVSGGAYIANTSEVGSFTITLPSNPSDNDYVLIADGYGSWKNANLTVGRNGQNIAGEAADLTADTNYATLRLTYKTTPDVTSSYIGWVLT
jgi:hypothetical protein|tara:strand:- start:839 stop:1468 length:630 start_codon:yes stop_codon:yes gene_type:complete